MQATLDGMLKRQIAPEQLVAVLERMCISSPPPSHNDTMTRSNTSPIFASGEHIWYTPGDGGGNVKHVGEVMDQRHDAVDLHDVHVHMTDDTIGQVRIEEPDKLRQLRRCPPPRPLSRETTQQHLANFLSVAQADVMQLLARRLVRQIAEKHLAQSIWTASVEDQLKNLWEGLYLPRQLYRQARHYLMREGQSAPLPGSDEELEEVKEAYKAMLNRFGSKEMDYGEEVHPAGWCLFSGTRAVGQLLINANVSPTTLQDRSRGWTREAQNFLNYFVPGYDMAVRQLLPGSIIIQVECTMEGILALGARLKNGVKAHLPLTDLGSYPLPDSVQLVSITLHRMAPSTGPITVQINEADCGACSLESLLYRLDSQAIIPPRFRACFSTERQLQVSSLNEMD